MFSRLTTCILLISVMFLACTPMIKGECHEVIDNDLIIDVETYIPCHVQCFLCLEDTCCWSDRLKTVTGECEGKVTYWQFFMFPDLPDGNYKLRVEATTENQIEVQNYDIKIK